MQSWLLAIWTNCSQLTSTTWEPLQNRCSYLLALKQLLDDPFETLVVIEHVWNELSLHLLLILGNIVFKSFVNGTDSYHYRVLSQLTITSIWPNEIQAILYMNNWYFYLICLNQFLDLNLQQIALFALEFYWSMCSKDLLKFHFYFHVEIISVCKQVVRIESCCFKPYSA